MPTRTRYIRDPETNEPVEVLLSYELWVYLLGRANLPVPKNATGEEILPDPELAKIYGDPVEYQRRLRDGDD